MGWEKLSNPKPTASSIPATHVKVLARSAIKGDRRYIQIKLGHELCRKAGLHKDSHQCHLMLGTGDERAKLAIALDDAGGAFTAKKRANGRYDITISGAAADGRFQLQFPPFERDAAIVPMNGSPPIITFGVGVGFLVV